MAPEYGATMGFFPVDAETLRYLERTGRDRAMVERVERYCKEQGLFRTDATPDPEFTSTLDARPRHGGAEPRGPQAAAGPGAAHRAQAEFPGLAARADDASGARRPPRGGPGQLLPLGQRRRLGRRGAWRRHPPVARPVAQRRGSANCATAPSSSPRSPAAPTPRIPR